MNRIERACVGLAAFFLALSWASLCLGISTGRSGWILASGLLPLGAIVAMSGLFFYTLDHWRT